MIKCEKDKNECTITGEAKEVLNEFAIICYGLLQGGFDNDVIYGAMMTSFEAYKENDKKREKEKRRKK